MSRAALTFLLLAACGSSTTPVTDVGNAAATGSGGGAGSAAGSGGPGAVCSCGERGARLDGDEAAACEPVTCAEGLVCGYPCGIPGCDSVCMTEQDASLPRP